MNISIKLNKVQEEQLKEIMNREKISFTQKEIIKFFRDKINNIYHYKNQSWQHTTTVKRAIDIKKFKNIFRWKYLPNTASFIKLTKQ